MGKTSNPRSFPPRTCAINLKPKTKNMKKSNINADAAREAGQMEEVNYLGYADLVRAMELAAKGVAFRGSLQLSCDMNEAGADVAWSADVITPFAAFKK